MNFETFSFLTSTFGIAIAIFAIVYGILPQATKIVLRTKDKYYEDKKS